MTLRLLRNTFGVCSVVLCVLCMNLVCRAATTPVDTQADTQIETPQETPQESPQETSVETLRPEADPSWIFIPVNPAGVPTGGTYYLPLDMFRQLYRTPATLQKREDEERNRYFFRSAIYSGVFIDSLTSRDLIVDTIHAKYEVEVRLPETKIHFPFSTTQVYLSPGTALLNGVPIQTFRENDGVVVNLAKPGRYVLEFTLIPIVAPQESALTALPSQPTQGALARNKNTSVAMQVTAPLATQFATSPVAPPVAPVGMSAMERSFLLNGFRFSIPRIPSSRLEIQVPPSFNALEFPTAEGAKRYNQTNRTWVVQLGNIPTLAVEWKASSAHSGRSSALMADELYSWELGAENRILHCRYRFRTTEGSCTHLEWQMESSLNFQPENVEVFLWKEHVASPYAEVRSGETKRQLVPYTGKKEFQTWMDGAKRHVILTLADPSPHPVLVRFSLTTPGAGNAGSYVLPAIQTVKTRVMRRWFQIAAATDCQLVLEQTAVAIPTISIQEFTSSWNDFAPAMYQNALSASIIPAFVLDDTAGQSQSQLWVVRSQPLPAISTVQESLSYGFEKDAVRVNYVIQFPSIDAIPALLHLNVPENLNIDKIILHGAQQKNLRYSRNSLTGLAIFHEEYRAVGVDAESLPKTENDAVKEAEKEAVNRAKSARNSEKNQIVLTGFIELPTLTKNEGVEIDFPSIHLAGSALFSTSRLVHFYRAPSVLITEELYDQAGNALEPFTTAGGKSLAQDGVLPFENVRLVSTFSVSAQQKIHGKIRIAANNPKITLDCCTVMKVPMENPTRNETGEGKKEEPTLPQKASETDSETESETASETDSESKTVTVHEADAGMMEANAGSHSGGARKTGKTGNADAVGASHAQNSEMVATPDPTTLFPTTLFSTTPHWQLTVEMFFTVEKGLADEIVVEIPGDVTMPFILEPEMPFEVEPINQADMATDMATDMVTDGASNASHLATAQETEKSTIKNAQNVVLDAFTPDAGGEWVRIIIRPQKPISGILRLRLTGELRENRLDSSIQNALVRLPMLRFPGIEIRNHDVVLPLPMADGMRNHYRWAIKGMLPLRSPHSQHSANLGTDNNAEKDARTALHQIRERWLAEKDARVYHVVDTQYTAQLLANEKSMTNPMVEIAVHSLFWDSRKQVLGVGIFDIHPQKSPTCILRLPLAMKLLEIHLDSRPVQTEEVLWDAEQHAFVPFSAEKLRVAGSKRGTDRFYRLTFRSLQLPQRLEVLYHTQLADSWEKRPSEMLYFLDLPSEVASGVNRKDDLYRLRLPVLIHQENQTYTPIQARSGATFFYTDSADSARLKLWARNGKARKNASGTVSATATGTQKTERIAENRDKNGTVTTRGTSFRGKGTSQNKTSTGTSVSTSASTSATAEYVALSARPWNRILLLFHEHFLDMTSYVSNLQPTGQASREELQHWFENWNVLRFGNEKILQHSIQEYPGDATSTEIRDNFQQLKSDGERLFAHQLGTSALNSEKVVAKLEQLRQNSLWFVFLRNLPHRSTECQVAFDTGSSSDFYVAQPPCEVCYRPTHLWQAVFTLFFTFMIALGIYFHPSIPEDVRTQPFWLLCIGTLCLLGGLNFWFGIPFLVASVISLVYRIGKLARD